MDFYIKECMENEAGHESDPNSKDLYNFLQFDKYSAELQGWFFIETSIWEYST